MNRQPLQHVEYLIFMIGIGTTLYQSNPSSLLLKIQGFFFPLSLIHKPSCPVTITHRIWNYINNTSTDNSASSDTKTKLAHAGRKKTLCLPTLFTSCFPIPSLSIFNQRVFFFSLDLYDIGN